MPQEIQAVIEVREWDMRNPRHLDVFKTVNVKRLPSIAVNGELIYASLIPDQEELVDSIAAAHRVLPRH